MQQAKTFGRTFSDYEIIKQLGRGSYGTVFQARCKLTTKVVVVKVICIRTMKSSVRKSAFREVSLMKSLSHPNIIKYENSFFDEDNLYIVMEYAEKGDLSQLIKIRKQRNNPFTQQEIWKMATQMLGGLQYLHSKSIIHRDIKTSNIFIVDDGVLKVLLKDMQIGDLGVSKILTCEAMQQTRIGTPLYLAPELIRHEAYDFKVDVWGMGCILYLLAALQSPFYGKNIFHLGESILKEQPKPLPNRYSDSLQRLIRQMLQKNSRLRPSCQNLLTSFHLLNNHSKSQNQSLSSTKLMKTLKLTEQSKGESMKTRYNNYESSFQVVSFKKIILEAEASREEPDPVMKATREQEKSNHGSVANTKRIDSPSARSKEVVKVPPSKRSPVMYTPVTEPDELQENFNSKVTKRQPAPNNMPESVNSLKITRRPMSAAVTRNPNAYNPVSNGITLKDLLRITNSKHQIKDNVQFDNYCVVKPLYKQLYNQQRQFDDEQVQFPVHSLIRPSSGIQNGRHYKQKPKTSQKGQLCMSKSFVKPKCPTIELKRPDLIAIAYCKRLQN